MALFINDLDEQMIAIAREPACICCLNKDIKLVKLTKCNHSGLLELLTTMKLEYEESYVCYICHHLLEKLDKFKKQVQDSLFAMKQKLWDTTRRGSQNKYTFSELEVCNYNGNSTETEQSQTGSEEFMKPIEYIDINADSNQECLSFEIDKVDRNYEDSVTVEMEMDVKVEDVDSTVCEVELSGSQEKAGSSVDDTLKDQTLSTGQKKIVVNPLRVKYITLTESEALAERAEKRKQRGYELATYRCETCIMAFHHEQYLQEHIESKHSQKLGDKLCKFCHCLFDTRAALTEHLKKHYNRYECMDCNKRYGLYSTAQRHYNECHSVDKEVYACAKCDFKTKSFGELRQHREQHNSGRNTCTLCGALFSAKSGLKRHTLLFHMANRVHKCTKCDKRYKYKNALIGHMKAQHMDGEPEAEFYCAECNIHFKTKYSLRSHMARTRAHLKTCDFAFSCHDCGKNFADKKQLESHITFVHLKKSKHVCHVCSKIFRGSSSLRDHIKFIHENCKKPRKYICDHCGKGFKAGRSLVSHIRSHTGERPLQCRLCPATFAHPAAIYNHNKRLHKLYPQKPTANQ